MSVEATNNVTSTYVQMPPPAPEKIEANRKIAKENPDQVETITEKSGVQPEEIISKIKALAQGGLYSVNFEIDNVTKQLIVKIVDSETKAIIRQIPAQEMLGLKEALSSYQGNIVNTNS